MKKKILKELIKIFWIFLIVSFFGFLYETGLYFLKHQILIRKNGLLFLPISQVYGIGGIFYYLVLIKLYKNKKGVFFISMLLGGIIEYFLSFFQELMFGTVSWNYNEYFLNIHGRTSLFHMIFWGIAGIVFIKYIYPFSEKLIIKLSKSINILTIILLIILLFDVTTSYIAAKRYNERRINDLPNNKIEFLIDKCFPDNFMKKAYPHSKFTKIKK